jgi:penicillin amidase
MLGEFSKSGSNSWAVMGRLRPADGAERVERDRRGAAIMANDPHVGFNVPALWVVVGARSPGYEALGFTIPGLPVVLLGTNGTIAWGGTNMVGLASAMYDVTDVPDALMTSRTERINVRFWADAERVIETSPVGPVMTGTPLLSPGRTMPREQRRRKIAWAWRGQWPSDEVSAFLDANRARDFASFRAAFAPYAVSGQNFVYADASGNIGQVIALSTSPAAGRIASGEGEPIGKVSASGEVMPPFVREGVAGEGDGGRDGLGFVGPTDLPYAYNPASGFVISANNTPIHTDPPLTLTTNANDRMDRLAALIAADRAQSVESHARHQMDVYSIASHALARAIVEWAGASGSLGTPGASDSATAGVLRDLAAWDGQYAVDSRGAAVVHRVMYFLGKATYEKMYGKKSAGYLLGSSALADFLREDLGTPAAPGAAAAHLASALREAGNSLEPGQVWGDIHRLRVAHPLGLVPIVGGSWRFDEFPVAGSLTTVFKTATDAGPGVQRTRYGANARHISDLRDPDENYFVLMGGQDGWIGSANFADQVALWREGRLIRVPFTREAVATEFPVVTRIR